FFFNDTATTEIYTVGNTLSLHDALPIDTAKAVSAALDLPLVAVPTTYAGARSEEHTSELQSLPTISYAGFCLKKKRSGCCRLSALTRRAQRAARRCGSRPASSRTPQLPLPALRPTRLRSFFFFIATAPTEIYTVGNTLSLHDALPICRTTTTGSASARRTCTPPRSRRSCPTSARSEEHTSELQSLPTISYAVFCLKKKKKQSKKNKYYKSIKKKKK